MKNVYKMRFLVSGELIVEAESMTDAVDKVMANFRDSGANNLAVHTPEINGEKVDQGRSR